MKRVWPAGLMTIVSGIVIVIVAPAAAAVSDGIAAPYLHIQLALANDSTEGVPEAARAIAAEAATMGDSAKRIAAAAAAVAGASTIKVTRAAFGPLSDALIAYGEEVGFGDLRVAYCPMVRKSWVQEAGDLRNPFYGSEMLTCGNFTK